ncbi:hypothetical protein CDAR_443001 [Caerostris darwini]|uniref:Uncharacterized protein n=1 Tax=Caerostris darwini TaxID=1538125 RepID=A0AAV4VP34_9ARAC|nr:hypothetical protein CDAR_443001 [Caerostris darwini]
MNYDSVNDRDAINICFMASVIRQRPNFIALQLEPGRPIHNDDERRIRLIRYNLVTKCLLSKLTECIIKFASGCSNTSRRYYHGFVLSLAASCDKAADKLAIKIAPTLLQGRHRKGYEIAITSRHNRPLLARPPPPSSAHQTCAPHPIPLRTHHY